MMSHEVHNTTREVTSHKPESSYLFIVDYFYKNMGDRLVEWHLKEAETDLQCRTWFKDYWPQQYNFKRIKKRELGKREWNYCRLKRLERYNKLILNSYFWDKWRNLSMKWVGGSAVKNPPANAGDVGLIPDLGRSPGGRNGNLLQNSHLGKPMDIEA